jgi:DNA-binding MarR family transcriptional regulator
LICCAARRSFAAVVAVRSLRAQIIVLMPSSDSQKKRPAKPGAGSSESLADFNVGASLRYTYRFIYQAMQEQLAPYDISMGMFYFFMCLWKGDGLTQRELSDRVGTMGPGTVEQLRRMELRGFIKRRPSVVDRRKMHVFLTSKGRALKNEIVPLARQLNVNVLRGMREDDIQFLRGCLLQIRKNMRAIQNEGRKPSSKTAGNRAELIT